MPLRVRIPRFQASAVAAVCAGAALLGATAALHPAPAFGPPSIQYLRAAADAGAPGRSRVVQVPAEGEPSEALPGGLVGDHAVHPSGEWSAFSDRGALRVSRMGGRARLRYRAAAPVAGLAWSPDAAQLAFESEGRVWVIGRGEGEPLALTPAPAAAGRVAASSPAWSLAGNRVFHRRFRVAADGSTAGHALWKVAPDGTAAREVPLPAGLRPTLPGIAVSPAGDAVLYVTGTEARPAIVRYDLAAGTARVMLEDARDPAFSGSGNRLAFVRQGEVMACDYADGRCGPPSALTRGGNASRPGWIGN